MPNQPRARDPERRRREILEAATEIMTAQGAAALTHRAVAAQAGIALGTITRHFPSIDELRLATLSALADETDAVLEAFERQLAASEDVANALATQMHNYLSDGRAVHASMALVTAAATDPDRRDLSRRWTDQLTRIIAKYTTPSRASAIEVFLDGAVVHAALNDTPLHKRALTETIRALLIVPAASSTKETK